MQDFVNLICPKCGAKVVVEIQINHRPNLIRNTQTPFLETWGFRCNNCNFHRTRSFKKLDDMFYWAILVLPVLIFLIAIHTKTWSLPIDISLSIIGSIALGYFDFLIWKSFLSKILQKRVNLLASEPF